MNSTKATVTKVDKRIIVKERRVEGLLSYDVDNNYPARTRDIVNASGMGKSCVNLYKKFIYGNGFKDRNLSRIVVNSKGLTMDKLLYSTCENVAFNGGFSVHVNYNALYQIVEINHQPFSQIRFTTTDSDNPNMYAIHKDWSAKNIRRQDIVYINKFNPDPVVIQCEVDRVGGWQNYRGQIFYFSPDGDQYPLTIYDAVLEDMQTDFQTKTFKFRQVTTNFMASHLLITDATESGNDEDNSNNRDKSQLTLQFEEFQGADNSGKIMIIEKSHSEQVFDLKKIDQQNGDKNFEWTENSTRDNIRQAFLIPSVLLMNVPGKLGTADEIIDATKYYNSITETERTILTEAFHLLSMYHEDQTLQKYDYAIEPKKAIVKEDIPASLMPDLTTNERRALMGYSELASGNTRTLAEKIGVGGVQAMLAIITDTTLTVSQKVNSLQVLFGLTEDEANKMLNDGINNTGAGTGV